jgi:hypothetical protein
MRSAPANWLCVTLVSAIAHVVSKAGGTEIWRTEANLHFLLADHCQEKAQIADGASRLGKPELVEALSDNQ